MKGIRIAVCVIPAALNQVSPLALFWAQPVNTTNSPQSLLTSSARSKERWLYSQAVLSALREKSWRTWKLYRITYLWLKLLQVKFTRHSVHLKQLFLSLRMCEFHEIYSLFIFQYTIPGVSLRTGGRGFSQLLRASPPATFPSYSPAAGSESSVFSTKRVLSYHFF